nr:MAG TPA: restriction alleviation protein [Caudoviricetes sp.]
MNEELKPCPFCGSKNIRMWNTSTPWVSCRDCFANTACGTTREEAIENWNRRVQDA